MTNHFLQTCAFYIIQLLKIYFVIFSIIIFIQIINCKYQPNNTNLSPFYSNEWCSHWFTPMNI